MRLWGYPILLMWDSITVPSSLLESRCSILNLSINIQYFSQGTSTLQHRNKNIKPACPLLNCRIYIKYKQIVQSKCKIGLSNITERHLSRPLLGRAMYRCRSIYGTWNKLYSTSRCPKVTKLCVISFLLDVKQTLQRLTCKLKGERVRKFLGVTANCYTHHG